MIFSKKTLFAAAMLAGAVISVSAATKDASDFGNGYLWTNDVQEDISINENLNITVSEGEAITLSGSFLSQQGSVLDSWDDENNNLTYKDDTETITISGGGTVEYAGEKGSAYYTQTYKLNRGDKHSDPEDLIFKAWEGFDSFVSAGNFTGTVVVEGEGTTLNLKGQLVQFVGLYKPNQTDNDTPVALEIGDYVGASVTLKDGAVLSFEESNKNLAAQRLHTNLLAERVNALNFVKNLHSDSKSVLRLGTDNGSHNRIVLYSSEADRQVDGLDYTYNKVDISTVGRLAGNGRLYVVGEGAVAFIGESELDPGKSTTGNTWEKGNHLADIIIDNYVTFVGANIYGKTASGADGSAKGEIEGDTSQKLSMLTDSEALAVAVDNVFANATAVQLGTTANATGTYQTLGQTQVLAGAVNASAISGTEGAIQDVSLVTVYGNQIFNNFQSLWRERSALMADASEDRASNTEAFLQSWNDGSKHYQRGSSKKLRVAGGSVLTINQDAYRDGWFQGEIITRLGTDSHEHDDLKLDDNGDGLVVKTGAGTFLYDCSSTPSEFGRFSGSLSRLRVEEGRWVSSLAGIEKTNVEIGEEGNLELLVDDAGFVTGLIKGSGTLELSRVIILENDLTSTSLSEVSDPAATLQYRRLALAYLNTPEASVQFTTEQSQFTGSVVVRDGLPLILGEVGEKSPSIFSSAESIILRGLNPEEERYENLLGSYDGTSLQYSSLQVLSGVQMVRNLIGEANYSTVTVEADATLVLTKTDDDAIFGGTISGNGNLINLGGSRTVRMKSNDNTNGGDLFGALISLSGALSVSQTNANNGFSGLFLANGSSATFSGNDYAKVGALIGEAETSVSASGDFTVGRADRTLSGREGEYFATAQYDKYEEYFTGTSLKDNFYKSLSDAATRSRSGKFTYDSTVEYLKNPAKLIYTTDENVYDGAFSRILASTKYDATSKTDKILEKMQSGAGTKNSARYDFSTGATVSADKLFSGEKTAAEWLRKVFSVENVNAFLGSKEAQLSAMMKDSLRALVNQIASGEEGVCAYLDGSNPKTASLNVEGWNKIVAAGGLEYLKAAYKGAGFDKMPDETLYSLITNFYPTSEKYQFQITSWNVAQIGKIYGVELINPDYDDLKAAFGYDNTDFAGTLSGSMNLVKIGSESLKLTGVNTYSGQTNVEAGELYVDYDAIAQTSGVLVKSGALLTINATKEMIADSYRDPETGKMPTGYDPETATGAMFVPESQARLSGGGVVLKVGDGVVDLGNALLDVPEGGVDFTGTFLVAEGGLVATVDAEARSPKFGITLNAVSQYDNTGNAIPASFKLAFAREEANNAIFRSPELGAVELNFEGKIEGKGTFILDAGISGYVSGEKFVSLGNNTLAVAGKNFSPTDAEIASGALRIDADGTALSTKTFALGSDAELVFDLSANTTLSGSVISGTQSAGTETLRVSATGLDLTNDPTGATYEKRELDLQNVRFANVDAIELVGGAQLKIGELNGTPAPTDDEKKIVLSSLVMGSQTSLELGFGRTIELSGDSVLAGALTGRGTLTFSGETLTLGSTDSAGPTTGFSGTLSITGNKDHTINLNAGAGRTVDFNGLSVTAAADENVTFVKNGEGSVKISENASVVPKNKINVENLNINVLAGTLEVGAGLFTNQPDSLAIAEGATFRFSDPLTNFALDNLGSLSGAGTLSFSTANTATITANGNIKPEAFTGIIDVGNNVTLDLAANVEEFAAFSGAGTINVKSGKLTVTVNANETGAQKFDGTLTGLTDLTVVGDGAMVLESVPTGLNSVTVGSATQSGGFGVGATKNLAIKALGAESRILITNAGTAAFAGTVSVGENVSSLVLLRDGELDLSAENAVSKAFKLKTEGGEDLLLNGSENSPLVTLGNVAGSDLTLTDLVKLNETIELSANANANGEGGLVFKTTPNAFRAVRPTEVTVWSKDISGTGGITVDTGTNLQLDASVLSYEGETLVKGGSTLIYGAEKTVSKSSKLEIASGGTLIGGVSLVGESSDVVFNSGTTFVFTGDGIEFTGTAEVVAGKLKVEIDTEATSVRGTPVSLFKYIGSGNPTGKNKITFNNLTIVSADGLNYYKDPAQTGSTSIYIVANDLANAGVDLHEGISSEFVGLLNDITQTNAGELKNTVNGIVLKEGRYNTLTAAGQLAEAIIKTPNSDLAGTLNNLSPLSYGAMLALPQSGFVSDIAAISSRIEQRRYDSYTQFAWEIHDDWEFFAQAQGTLAQADEGKPDTRTFDMNSYGAIAGMDVKMNATTVAGFSFAYDFGDADIHDNGGEIQSHDVRATAFIGKLIENRFYVDAGVQAGFAMFDVDRRTVLGGVNGDTTAWHAGAFANAGMLIPLGMSEDEKTSVNLMPYVGLAYSYYGVNAFDESGAATALDTDSFGASSLRATVGASLAVTFPWLGKTSRFNLDVAYTRELMDSDVDIDYAMPEISDASYTASAKTFAEDTFSIGPRLSYDLDRNNSIYGGYRFEMSTDSDTAHSVNLGFRSRF